MHCDTSVEKPSVIWQSFSICHKRASKATMPLTPPSPSSSLLIPSSSCSLFTNVAASCAITGSPNMCLHHFLDFPSFTFHVQIPSLTTATHSSVSGFIQFWSFVLMLPVMLQNHSVSAALHPNENSRVASLMTGSFSSTSFHAWSGLWSCNIYINSV